MSCIESGLESVAAMQVLTGQRKPARLTISVALAALLLSQDYGDSSIPIIEAALFDLSLKALLLPDLLDMALSGKPRVDVYSSEQLDWEPLLEPWAIEANLRLGPIRSQKAAVLPKSNSAKPLHGMNLRI